MTKIILMSVAAVLTTFTMSSSTMASVTPLSYSSYTVIGDDITMTGPVTLYGIAGRVQMTTTEGVLDVWCVDVSIYLQNSGVDNAGSLAAGVPGIPTGITETQIGEMGALILHGDLLVANPPAAFNQSDVSAAIQTAIWTIENGNVFTYDAVNPVVTSLTSQYIYDATNVWAPYFNITTFSSADGQNDNQTMATIPELPSWLMMLIGFAGVSVAITKRRKGTKQGAGGLARADRPARFPAQRGMSEDSVIVCLAEREGEFEVKDAPVALS